MRRLVASEHALRLVGDEPYMAEAIRDGLRLEAIAGDGDTALELLSVNAVLDRDIPGPTGDEIASSPPAAACRSSWSPGPAPAVGE
jgi:hypothetical protein